MNQKQSFSLIVNGDSSVNLNFEHAWGDGAAILNIERTIFNYLHKNVPEFEEPTEQTTSPFTFELDPHLEEQIANAQKFHEDRLKSFKSRTIEVGNAPAFKYPKWFTDQDISSLRKFDLDRNWMKSHKIGPDAFMQISLQLAAADYYGIVSEKYFLISTSLVLPVHLQFF